MLPRMKYYNGKILRIATLRLLRTFSMTVFCFHYVKLKSLFYKTVYQKGINLIMDQVESVMFSNVEKLDFKSKRELRGKWRAKADALIPV